MLTEMFISRSIVLIVQCLIQIYKRHSTSGLEDLFPGVLTTIHSTYRSFLIDDYIKSESRSQGVYGQVTAYSLYVEPRVVLHSSTERYMDFCDSPISLTGNE